MFEKKKKKIEEISSSSSSSMVSNVHHPPYLSLGSDASISSSSSFQRHKPNNKDIISNLPHNVLIHILSFLDISIAIQKTSILSTKWRYLWTYLPVIDHHIFFFSNRVYSFLDTLTTLIHKSNHHQMEIQRLSIGLPPVALDAHKITFLVTSLLRLKIIDLEFFIADQKYLGTSCVLPCGFSPSYSLRKLWLNLGGYTLYIPNGIQFPNLKTLYLSYATFANDESVEEFFAGCPLLEELTLKNCYWLYIKQITIAISTLRMLTIRFDPNCLRRCVDCEKFSVKIDAVNLLSLTCISDPTIQFVIVNPPTSMVDAYIALSSQFPQDQQCAEYVSHCANVLLSGLASVKSLELSDDTFIEPKPEYEYEYEDEDEDEDEPEPPVVDDHFHLLPEFHNLTHLCLDLDTKVFTRKSIMQFLLRCPKLEVLVFPLGHDTFKDNHDWTLIPLPCCFKSSLKKLHITKFDGFECEIQFVKFFLENATVLEEFQVSLSRSLHSKYYPENLADLKNQFVGMANCDILRFDHPNMCD